MPREFVQGIPHPSPAEQRGWYVGQMFDDDGWPADVETGLIIQPFLDHPDRTFSVIEISERTGLGIYMILCYCRQLQSIGGDCILTATTAMGSRFKLNRENPFTLERIEIVRVVCNKFS